MPVALKVDNVCIAPDICFETLLPHFIRGQVAQLSAAGNEPDLLANLTNDGWFWGSSELDLHLMCGIFRAVECRKPLVIAANTGFSAVIDADGRVLAQGPRRETGTLVYDLALDTRRSPYVRFWRLGRRYLLAGVRRGGHDRSVAAFASRSEERGQRQGRGGEPYRDRLRRCLNAKPHFA